MPEEACVNDTSDLFPATYESSRARFRDWLPRIARSWPDAALHQHALSSFPELTIDWITAGGKRASERMLVFTSGEHGVEGYVGSAMLELFLRRFLPQLDPAATGLTLVHAVDPWGMKHYRRTNPNNVDLNRNFVLDESRLDPAFNPFYPGIEGFVGSRAGAGLLAVERIKFLAGYLARIARHGRDAFWAGKVLGQYAYPEGIHYGGTEFQEEVRVAQTIYRQALASAGQVLHLDMHTGYGPRYQMTIVNSPLEGRSSAAYARELGYPLVAAMTPDEFYAIRGDMIDYVYRLRQEEFPEVDLYAAAFEFGTFGERHWDNYRLMRALVFENRLYWRAGWSPAAAEAIRGDFVESFSPSESRWRRKALTDADQALAAILRMRGFIE